MRWYLSMALSRYNNILWPHGSIQWPFVWVSTPRLGTTAAGTECSGGASTAEGAAAVGEVLGPEHVQSPTSSHSFSPPLFPSKRHSAIIYNFTRGAPHIVWAHERSIYVSQVGWRNSTQLLRHFPFALPQVSSIHSITHVPFHTLFPRCLDLLTTLSSWWCNSHRKVCVRSWHMQWNVAC